MAYNLLKLFLPEKAQAKWKVYGIQRVWWQWALFKDVSPGELSQQYGGISDIPAASTTTDVSEVSQETTKGEVDKELPEDDEKR